MKNFFKSSTLIAFGIVISLASVAYGASVIFPYQGGTGTSTVPTNEQILVGQGGIYVPSSTLKQTTYAGTSSPAYVQGRLVYDTANESLTFMNNDSNVSLQIGQEEWVQVRNNTGSTITNGTPVYINGGSNGVPTVALAQSNVASTTIVTGLTTENITNGSIGYVTIAGLVHDVDTSAYAAGTTLFLGSTTAGTLTSSAPLAPYYRFRVGVVASSSSTNGSIHVTPSTGALGNGTVGQVLIINASGSQAFVSTSSLGISGGGVVNYPWTVGAAKISNATSTDSVLVGTTTVAGQKFNVDGGVAIYASSTANYAFDVQSASGVGKLVARIGAIGQGGITLAQNSSTGQSDLALGSTVNVGINATPVSNLSLIVAASAGREGMRIQNGTTGAVESVYQANVNTTSAATSTMNPITTTATDGAMGLSCSVIGYRTGGVSGAAGDMGYYEISGAFKKISGTLTQVSATVTKVELESQVAWTAGFFINSNSANVVVGGAASNNITWETTCRRYEI